MIAFSPEEAPLFQKLYETFNSHPLWPEDPVKGVARDKRNGEILDALDAMSDEDTLAEPWFQVGYARLLHTNATLTLTNSQLSALIEMTRAGGGMWLPSFQKKFIRPLLAKLEAALG